MTRQKIEEYKKKLEAERRAIEDELKQNSLPPDLGSDNDSFEEESDETEALSNQLSVVQDLRSRLIDIESALREIDVGGYGICEDCKKPISESVLDVDPESRLCQDCKSKK